MYLAGDCGLTERKMDHMKGRRSFYTISFVNVGVNTIPLVVVGSPVVRTWCLNSSMFGASV